MSSYFLLKQGYLVPWHPLTTSNNFPDSVCHQNIKIHSKLAFLDKNEFVLTEEGNYKIDRESVF